MDELIAEIRQNRKWAVVGRIGDVLWFLLILGFLVMTGWALLRMDDRSAELHRRLETPVPVVIVTPRPGG